MEIEIYGYTIRILKQYEYPWTGYYASNDILIESVNVPEVVYKGGRLTKVYLRGEDCTADNEPLVFYNIQDLFEAVKAIKEYCDWVGMTFKITEGRTVIECLE